MRQLPSRPSRRTVRRRAVAVAAGAAMTLVSLAPAALAETPSPDPSATAAPTPTATPTPTASAATQPEQVSAAAGPALSLAITSVGGPVAGAFYEDLGRFAFAGAATEVADGTTVRVARRVGTGAWTTVATAKVSQGRYAAQLAVQAAGASGFRAVVSVPESEDVASAIVPVTVRDATVSLVKPVATINSLKNLGVRGVVVPARAGVPVRVEVRRGSGWQQVATTKTGAKGTFSTSVGYGKGALASYTLRVTHRATNRDRTEVSGTRAFRRVAVLDARVRKTTSADVAKTYRKGCPVGPSKLRTIEMNYYGRDKRMHRGVMIIRRDLTPELTRGFSHALAHRYPVAKMRNPNVYGGLDPKQMEANNTSGFNCRKVVGNPYAQSPHSYGIAIDVNTVQNPYRDRNGKWWPKNGKSYIDRTPKRWGMLTKGSHLTASLRRDDFFWGGLWNPGRDYQHFEYRG